MNVEELLKYQPSSSVDDVESSYLDEPGPSNGRSVKKIKLDTVDWDQIKNAPAPLDEASLKRTLLSFERKLLKNQELRVKFSDHPSKFMDSECELFEILQELHSLSTQPELYQILIDMKMIPPLVGILSHENTDISIAGVTLINELTDTDSNDELTHVSSLMEAMMEQQLLVHLVSLLDRLNESVKEESDGIFNIFSIIENLLEVKPQISSSCESLIKWIIKRLQVKSIPFNQNKLYASEVLSILVQSTIENRKYLGSLDGIDVLLQQLAQYKKKEASNAQEKEFIENVYDCLCSCLLDCNENRQLFLKAEGIELMFLILRDQKSTLKQGALKVLSHVSSPDQVTFPPTLEEMKTSDDPTQTQHILTETCNKFVDLLGLRVVLPIFMKPKSILSGLKKKELDSAIESVEEHSVNIICSLFRFCSTEQVKRTTVKFVESDFEKTERLIELHLKYTEKLDKWERKEKQRLEEEEDDDDEEDEDDLFMRKITEGGLYTLQLIHQVILIASYSFDKYFSPDHPERETINQRVRKLLKLHTSNKLDHNSYITKVISDLIKEQNQQNEKERLTQLLESFNNNSS